MRAALPGLLVASFLALAAAPTPAAAQTRCMAVSGRDVAVLSYDGDLPTAEILPPDDPGLALCRTEQGAAFPARRDGLGRLTIRDADGDLVHGATDGFGTTTFRPDDRRTLARPDIEATADALGNPVIRDATGAVHFPVTDGLGNSTVRTDDGRIFRCFTDPAGVTVCD